MYKKPAFITFSNHTLMILFFPVVAAINRRMNRRRIEPLTFKAYLRQWAGCRTVTRLFFVYGIVAIGYNVSIYWYMKGLETISVSLSNGIYQIQVGGFCCALLWRQ